MLILFVTLADLDIRIKKQKEIGKILEFVTNAMSLNTLN
jgi:hypothetical protein